jgi:hypothetical protein
VKARLLIDSLRSFGGIMDHCSVYVYDSGSIETSGETFKDLDVDVFPLILPDAVKRCWFAGKVWACAQAEQKTSQEVHSLVWISPDCLVVRPPLLFELSPSFDVAVRPVHIKNIGLRTEEPLDDFWKMVYAQAGAEDTQRSVTSFVDGEHIRAYFNSHALAVNPAKGLFSQWFECFERLACDGSFQAGACRDDLHRIFLHQALLSALITTTIEPQRIRILPADYSYPYNLHTRVPSEKRVEALNDLVCVAYENRSLDPDEVNDIAIAEPLRGWLSARMKQIG